MSHLLTESARERRPAVLVLSSGAVWVGALVPGRAPPAPRAAQCFAKNAKPHGARVRASYSRDTKNLRQRTRSLTAQSLPREDFGPVNSRMDCLRRGNPS